MGFFRHTGRRFRYLGCFDAGWNSLFPIIVPGGFCLCLFFLFQRRFYRFSRFMRHFGDLNLTAANIRYFTLT
ncbi:MAG: hypothetical protein DYG98_19615 [Haliscomenobacteraceae bacterium CHB4]|nr:hypothetical protein [Haliscomenobacteraceae bacterium CHB4]